MDVVVVNERINARKGGKVPFTRSSRTHDDIPAPSGLILASDRRNHFLAGRRRQTPSLFEDEPLRATGEFKSFFFCFLPFPFFCFPFCFSLGVMFRIARTSMRPTVDVLKRRKGREQMNREKEMETGFRVFEKRGRIVFSEKRGHLKCYFTSQVLIELAPTNSPRRLHRA
jgi:hypothetical protein